MKPPKGVPRDEWLLAIGIAVYSSRGYSGRVLSVTAADSIAGMSHKAADKWRAAADGAYSVIWGIPRGGVDFPDYHSAGAALVMALEGDDR